MIENTIKRLEDAIEGATGELDNVEGMQLLAAAGEALGALKVYGSIGIVQIMYDMATLAGMAGGTPNHFEDVGKHRLELPKTKN